MDALLNLEGTDRFGGVGGFVNVSRHRRKYTRKRAGRIPFRERLRDSTVHVTEGLMSNAVLANRAVGTSELDGQVCEGNR